MFCSRGCVRADMDKENSICSEVYDIPDSLIIATLDGEDEHIVSISPTSIRLREPVSSVRELAITYFDFKSAVYHTLLIEKYDLKDGLIFVDYKPFSDAVGFVTEQYYQYIVQKSESVDSLYSEQMVGYPSSKDYEITPASQIAKNDLENLFTKVLKTATASKLELAFSLPNHAMWCDFIEGKFVLPSEVRRIYVGSQFCDLLLPEIEELEKLIDRCTEKDMALTLCFSFLRNSRIEYMTQYLLSLSELLEIKDYTIELTINDLGYLSLVKPYPRITPVLGILLNKRRKDPRYPYKKGFEVNQELLAENQLNFAGFTNYLNERRIYRFEYESCGYDIAFASGKHSLHLPLYQTNTSAYCTLKARCERGDRGAQSGNGECGHYCEKNSFLYPQHLGIFGIGNSLFAFDKDAALKSLSNSQSIDRIVWNGGLII